MPVIYMFYVFHHKIIVPNDKVEAWESIAGLNLTGRIIEKLLSDRGMDESASRKEILKKFIAVVDEYMSVFENVEERLQLKAETRRTFKKNALMWALASMILFFAFVENNNSALDWYLIAASGVCSLAIYVLYILDKSVRKNKHNFLTKLFKVDDVMF